MPTAETRKLVLAAAAAAEDKKAEDIRILELDPSEASFTDYFLICNGTNERQNVAISDGIEYKLKKEYGVMPNSVEGRRQGEWILLDYVDFVVHIFSAEKRAFYGLERLRKSARTISIDELNSELKARVDASRAKKAPAKKAPAKKAAAKKAAARAVPAKAAPAKVATKAATKAVAKAVAKPATPVAASPVAKKAAKKAASPAKKAVAKKTVAKKAVAKKVVKKSAK